MKKAILDFKFCRCSTLFLHISLPTVICTLAAAIIFCADIGKRDSTIARFMFFEAAEYVLASLLICAIGAIFFDILDRDGRLKSGKKG